ncbi:unnamed protein product [Nezara viridula]|uniref:Cyclic nucleotide-binding domain-containing protein n=1 Tax=Nezara viridula TaxID=85310 RepID=A0A9P0H808_NEZVI|nr:unnamed protein product [Nezara viridula]
MDRKRKDVSCSTKIRSIIRKISDNKKLLEKILTDLRNTTDDESSDLSIDFEGDFINNKEKLLLLTRSESRKESDLKRLAQKLSFLEPFRQYPQSIIRKLVKYSRLIGFEAGRILLDAGDKPLCAYFILSGEVKVNFDKVIDPIQRLLETIYNGELRGHVQQLKTKTYGRGNLIGMNEFLYNEARPSRMFVTKDVLCIQFKKKYIIPTLLPLINQWCMVFEYLSEFEIFKYLEFEAKRELSTIGKVKKYQARSLIEATDTSYFLIEGEITVIQRLLVENYRFNRKPQKRLYHDQNALEYGNNVESIFMKVCVLSKGSYFGLGERISKSKLWTSDTCRVLYFSKQKLLQYGSPEVWNAIKARLDAMYPPDDEIFKIFQYGRDWLNYKKDLLCQLNRGRGLATIHEVPVTLRCMKLKRSFMRNVNMTTIPDYLVGGSDPLEDEINHPFVLDEGGPLREYMFGRFKTEPPHSFENTNVEEKVDNRGSVEYETFPSFLNYDLLK